MRSAIQEEAARVTPREHAREDTARADDSTLARSASRGEWRVVLAWTLAAFALRLAVLLCFEHVISPDGVEYVAHARRLAAGDVAHGMSTYWPPLYPALVAVASLVFRDAEFAGRLVSVVAGALLVLPAHRLARRWYGRRAALVCASLVALHPLLAYYSTALLTESTYTLIFTCAVVAGWSALTWTTARAYAFAGALFGACYLLKPEAFGFVLLLLVMLFAHRILTRASLRRMKTGLHQTSVVSALALVAGFVVAASPQLLYIRWQTGKWFLSAKTSGHLLQGARAAGGDAAAVYATGPPDALTAFVRLAKAMRFEYEIFNLIFPTAFVLLVALGLFRRRWTRARAAREAYLLAFVAATLAGYAVTLPNIRFLAPLVPLLLCWVSKGALEFAAWARGTLARFNVGAGVAARVERLTTPLVVAALVLSLAPLFVYLMRGDKWGDYYGQKRAGVWIKEHEIGRAPTVMSTVPVAAFYAGGRSVAVTDKDDFDTLLARARGEGARYVVVNQRDFRHMDSLRALLDARTGHAGLLLAQEFAEAADQRVLIYEVEGVGR